MRPQPQTLADLLERLYAPVPRAVKNRSPIMGSVEEVDHALRPRSRQTWAILHSVTDVGLKFFHPQPLASKHVAISLVGPSGEELHAILIRQDTEPVADLFETRAEFLMAPPTSNRRREDPRRRGQIRHRRRSKGAPVEGSLNQAGPQLAAGAKEPCKPNSLVQPAHETHWKHNDSEETHFF